MKKHRKSGKFRPESQRRAHSKKEKTRIWSTVRRKRPNFGAQ